MKRGIATLCALSLLHGCAARDATRSKGFADSLTTEQALGLALEPQRHAILIGVDHYEDAIFEDLHHAGADASAMAKVLRDDKGGGFDSVQVLSGEATREEVFRALRSVRSELRREDALLVYFSGHGTRVPDGDTWRRFLLTTDSRARNLEETSLDLAQLQGFFSELPAARKVLIVDACFNGDGKSVVRPDVEPASESVGALIDPHYSLSPGEAHLFATSAGRPSRESDKLGHGVYTYYLLEAMSWGFAEADVDGDQVVTAWEAHDFARGRTIRFTDQAQVPEAALRVTGEGDVILAGSRDQRRRREKALIYLYASDSHQFANTDLLVDGRVRGALPGTVSVTPGRHRIEVRRKDGEVVVDGYMGLSSDRAYAIEDVQRLANGPSRAVGVHPTVLTSAPMRISLGPGAVGMEVSAIRRNNAGPGRGIYTGWNLGGGGTPNRTVNQAASPRSVVWGGASAGYQADHQRLRYRIGWGFTGVFLPSSWPNGRPETVLNVGNHPEEAGWLVFASGPSTSLGWVLTESLTLVARPKAHFAVLNVNGEGLQAVPWLRLGIGPELSW